MARILVVDDNSANLELVVYLLKAFGHEPVGVSLAREGILRMRDEHFDLVLCDIRMPECDGFEFLEAVRSLPNCRSIPVVAVTALAMVGDRERILASGFDGYITKPIEPQDFMERVRVWLPSS